MNASHTPVVRVQKQWNSSSCFLVLADGKLLGTVYMPRGRKWGTVLAHDLPVWHQEVAACRSIEDGASILVQRGQA